MIDAQVNAEELAESRRQRDATANAADYGMPVTPASESRAAEGSQYREPKQWIRYAKMAVRCKQLQATVSVPMTDMKNISVQVEETAKDRFFRRRHDTDVQPGR